MEQLGLMSKALMSNLFPLPTKEELLVEIKSTAKGGGSYLFFSLNYFEKLTNKMQEHNDNGSYARSNAHSEWIDLMHTVMSAENISNIDLSNLEPHFLAK